MNVKRCDICSKIYSDPFEADRVKSVGSLNVFNPAYMFMNMTNFAKEEESIDLCSDCLKKILDFIDVLKEIHETGESYCIHICPKEEETK